MAKSKTVVKRLPSRRGLVGDTDALRMLVLQAADVFHDASKRVLAIQEQTSASLAGLVRALEAQQAETRAAQELLRKSLVGELGK